MKKAALIITLLLSLHTSNHACLNGESKLLNNGLIFYADRHHSVPMGHTPFATDIEIQALIRQMDSLYEATNDIEYLSDKGFLMIFRNQYQEAVNLYHTIERQAPGRYATASNIGTAYELLGQNDKALYWIRKAVEIDPTSHLNSEWIHIKILEAKIKGEAYINTRFLLNTDFGEASFPATKMSKQELIELFRALYYQLNERVSFVKPTDPIVAQLLFDLGNIELLLGDKPDARAIYKLAQSYGFTNPLIEERIEAANGRAKKAASMGHLGFGIGIAAILLITLLFIINKRRKSTLP